MHIYIHNTRHVPRDFFYKHRAFYDDYPLVRRWWGCLHLLLLWINRSRQNAHHSFFGGVFFLVPIEEGKQKGSLVDFCCWKWRAFHFQRRDDVCSPSARGLYEQRRSRWNAWCVLLDRWWVKMVKYFTAMYFIIPCSSSSSGRSGLWWEQWTGRTNLKHFFAHMTIYLYYIHNIHY